MGSAKETQEPPSIQFWHRLEPKTVFQLSIIFLIIRGVRPTWRQTQWNLQKKNFLIPESRKVKWKKSGLRESFWWNRNKRKSSHIETKQLMSNDDFIQYIFLPELATKFYMEKYDITYKEASSKLYDNELPTLHQNHLMDQVFILDCV